MNFKTVMIALTVAGLAAFGTGCSSACDDLKDCCEAVGGQGCDAYDDADDDACDAAKDQFKALASAGGDVPDECDF